MESTRWPKYSLLAALVLLTGTFSFNTDLLGKTVGAMLPLSSATTVSSDANAAAPAAVAPDSSSSIDALMAQIRANPRALPVLPPTKLDTETLWLARCIFSETKRPEEMELIAWVIRNRVETRYRGNRSYEEAVLDPYQFSAFNPQSRTRRYYAALGPDSKVAGWQKALTIAYSVRAADTTFRPFPARTRHFYSERSMVGKRHPDWARGLEPVAPEVDFTVEAKRFRFYAGVS